MIAALALFTLVDPRRAVATRPDEAAGALQSRFWPTIQGLTTNRTFMLVALGGVAASFVFYGLGAFYGSFFLRNHITALRHIADSIGMKPLGFLGLALGISSGVAGVFGAIVCGRVTDAWGRRNAAANVLMPVVCTICAAPLLFAAVLVDGLRLSIGLIAIASALNSAWVGGAYAAALGLAPARSRATASALMMFIFNLIGLGLGPLFVGLLATYWERRWEQAGVCVGAWRVPHLAGLSLRGCSGWPAILSPAIRPTERRKMTMGERLKDRCAIITGAASGIGHATAELFAEEGARVLAVDLPGVACRFSTDAIVPFEADVAADDTPARLVEAATSRLGGADIVFNNAAIERRMAFADMTDDAWDQMFHVSLRAGFRIARDFVPLLKRSTAGRIIFTSSMAAVRAIPGQASYAAAKAGMLALTRAMALELGPVGITANAILPGPVVTGITRDMTPESITAWTTRAPLRRLGLPEDVARVALFFASADSGYVTGQALAVDGGIFVGA